MGFVLPHLFSPHTDPLKAVLNLIQGEVRVQRQASFSPGEGALGWATCERSLVSGAVEVDTESPP